jgi:ATP-dependent Lon protease
MPEQTPQGPARPVTRRQAVRKLISKPSREEPSEADGLILTLPMIPLRGLTVFPGVSLTFDIARDKSRKAVQEALDGNQMVFLTAQKDLSQDWPAQTRSFRPAASHASGRFWRCLTAKP